MASHIPVCITLTAEEVVEVKRMVAENKTTISEWFGNQIRKEAKKKLPPRNNVGRPVSAGLVLLFCLCGVTYGQELSHKFPDVNVSPGPARYYAPNGAYAGRTTAGSQVYKAGGGYDGRVQHTQHGSRTYAANGAYTGRTSTLGSSTRFYSASGTLSGRSSISGSSTRYYDARGAYQARAVTSNGQTRYYDAGGRNAGRRR